MVFKEKQTSSTMRYLEMGLEIMCFLNLECFAPKSENMALALYLGGLRKIP
jgi:hypothetical protein